MSMKAAGIIEPSVCRERLDSALLASVGLISDKLYMDKKEVRTRTGLLLVISKAFSMTNTDVKCQVINRIKSICSENNPKVTVNLPWS
jgi:hypothetical protein